jgi:hypothetical protein
MTCNFVFRVGITPTSTATIYLAVSSNNEIIPFLMIVPTEQEILVQTYCIEI